MIKSVIPNDTAIPASDQALRFARSPNARASPRPAMTAITMAEVHSRSPVTAAGGISWNSLAAIPAPTCTETIPDTTIPAGSASRPRPVSPGDSGPAASGRPEARVSRRPASAVVLSFILALVTVPGAGGLTQGQLAQPGLSVQDQRGRYVGEPAPLVPKRAVRRPRVECGSRRLRRPVTPAAPGIGSTTFRGFVPTICT